MRLRAAGALVLFGLVSAGCRSGAPQGAPPPYLLDPRLGLQGPFPAQIETGWKLLRRGRPVDALRAFRDAGASPAGEVGRIESLVEAGRIEEATSACGKALQGGIGTAPLFAACGETALARKSWSEAFDLFEGAALRAPDFPQLSELKRRTAAKAASELVIEGEEALSDGEIAEAESAADRAVAIDAANRPALRLSGAAALAHDDEGKAFTRFWSAWKLDRSDRDSGEKAGDVALKIGRYDAGYEVFSALSLLDPRFKARAQECQEELVISNWPAADRQSAHAARLTRAQAAALLWRMLPDIRSVRVPAAAPIASDILSRDDQKVLAHCLGIGLLTVDAATHRARPDFLLTRTEAVRFLLRAAALSGLGKAPACVDEKVAGKGLLAAAAECGVLPAGKGSAVSGEEFRRGIAAILSTAGSDRK
ncbi:MAG: tetratricopeptide repeat protein [Thermoanaerobaculia bacterium]